MYFTMFLFSWIINPKLGWSIGNVDIRLLYPFVAVSKLEAVIAVDFILSFNGDNRLSGYGAVNITPTLGVITVGINPRTRNIVLVGKNSKKSF